MPSAARDGQAGPGHETRDAQVRPLAIFGGALLALVAATLASMYWLFRHHEARQIAQQPPPATLAAHVSDPEPPEPRLQANPLADLRQLQAEEEALLTGYGWVDRPSGIVRIPVEDAMRMVVTRGLASRPEPDLPPDRVRP